MKMTKKKNYDLRTIQFCPSHFSLFLFLWNMSRLIWNWKLADGFVYLTISPLDI